MTADGALFQLTDHVCRNCLGRVLRRHDLDGATVVQCSNCAHEAVGEPAAICCCGIKRGRYDRLRCVRIEHRIEGVAAEVVVTEVDDGR
jgi:hypothetical protein